VGVPQVTLHYCGSASGWPHWSIWHGFALLLKLQELLLVLSERCPEFVLRLKTISTFPEVEKLPRIQNLSQSKLDQIGRGVHFSIFVTKQRVTHCALSIPQSRGYDLHRVLLSLPDIKRVPTMIWSYLTQKRIINFRRANPPTPEQRATRCH
jgi:hypothetical protein